MAHEPPRIDFEDFASRLPQVFDQVRNRRQPVLVERDGETYRLERAEPTDIWKDYDPGKVQAGARRVAGILAGVDRDQLFADLYAQREQDSEGRPA
jgi:hypothetical protein